MYRGDHRVDTRPPMKAPATPRLASIQVQRWGGPCASMTLSLQAILEAYGRRVPLHEAATVTANAFMVTYAAGARPEDRWNMYARHAFVVEAARSYGLQLRALHPPFAAPLPLPPPEYALHFRDSYVPLIEAALARDEPVLAWMGWPAPQTAIWGIVTGVDLSSRRCFGRTMFSRGRDVEMPGPAVHAYLVQECGPPDSATPDAIGCVLRRASAVLNDELGATFGVTSGPAALARWREALLNDEAVLDAASLACDVHSGIARTLVAGRRAAMKYFASHDPTASNSQRQAIEACVTFFGEMIARLETFVDEEDLRLDIESEQHRRELADAVASIIPFEEQAAEALRTATA